MTAIRTARSVTAAWSSPASIAVVAALTIPCSSSAVRRGSSSPSSVSAPISGVSSSRWTRAALSRTTVASRTPASAWAIRCSPLRTSSSWDDT
ncbi:hypothetical protein ACFTXM_15765 [Streptomyces sp. NPDC056930]|uniref:hypothetical protein n=1 Tax=Streptomyces sp. NPDC056930 TaxID=3345967 RepID=UPI00362B3B44